MKIRDIMTSKPKIIAPDQPIKDAASLMKENDCGVIPVCNGDRLVGMVTDRDIVIRAVAEGENPDTPVSEVMTKQVLYCFENDDIEEVTEKMSDQQVRRLVVLNEKKRLTGIVSLGDVATKCKDQDLVADLTESVSEAA